MSAHTTRLSGLLALTTLAIGPGCATGTAPDAQPSDSPEVCDGIDNDGNGLIDDGLLTTVWDAESFSLSSFIGSGVAGSVHTNLDDEGSFVLSLVSSYDMDGNTVSYGYDFDDDELLDVSYSTTWENGVIVAQEHDGDGDGVADGVQFAVVEDGLVVEWHNDVDNDGDTDAITYKSYDQWGRLVLSQDDSDFDGILNGETTVTYNQAGDRREISHFDDDQDGITDRIHEAEYRFDGQPLSFRNDNEADGVWESTRSTFYSDGLRTMVTIENKGSDAVSTITYFYDGDDQLVETAYDNDGDGFMDSATAYVYAEGRFLSTLVDPDGDGPMAFYEAYESIYDPANNIVGSSSHGPDGSFQQRVQTDFSCR